MTEDEARQVLLLQAREAAGPTPLWPAEDRTWATQQALATVGETARPERFVVARAAVALQRLLPRDAKARRWLTHRAWHGAWVLLALVLGFVVGLVVDQLGPPQRVNLLAPAVWAVVGWNLLVYLALLLPLPTPHLREALARWGRRRDGDAALLWARHAAPLTLQRLALLLHAAAAALALGLITGLYLRGLVLDYRAGWQSTFLDAPTVQSLLTALLAPAGALTGIAVPDVTPLRVGPDGLAQASAAPWIHLFAATLAVFVVLPRSLLALWAAWRAGRLARRFPLRLDTAYFIALHPLMQPGVARAVKLLWAGEAAPPPLLGAEGALPLTLLRSDEGDELALLPSQFELAAAGAPRGAWQRWFGGPGPMARWRDEVDAVLLAAAPGAPRPPWLADLGKPVLVLVDGPAEPPALCLQALADGWLPDGRLLQALQALLPDDVRLRRLAATWERQQQQRFDARVGELAALLARVACAREPVADEGLLSRRADAEAAQQALAAKLEADLRDLPVPAAALRSRVGEGRAALMGGVVTGALAGLKADLLSGGMTMGAGLVTGGLLGALGGAGVARGLNVVRGTDRSFVAWDETALAAIAEALLRRELIAWRGLDDEAAGTRLAPALAAHKDALAAVWRGRVKRFANDGEADRLAGALRPPLAAALKQALA